MVLAVMVNMKKRTDCPTIPCTGSWQKAATPGDGYDRQIKYYLNS